MSRPPPSQNPSAPAPSAGSWPDAEAALAALPALAEAAERTPAGARLAQLARDLGAAVARFRADPCDPLYPPMASTAYEILETPATTIEALRVKAFAFWFTHSFERLDLEREFGETTDVRLVASILADLLPAAFGVAAPAAEPDPIFAAIERHRKAWVDLEAKTKLTDDVAAEAEGQAGDDDGREG